MQSELHRTLITGSQLKNNGLLCNRSCIGVLCNRSCTVSDFYTIGVVSDFCGIDAFWILIGWRGYET